MNRTKGKNHMIISICRKRILKNSALFLDKTLNKLGIKGTHLNIIKATANSILNCEKWKAFPLRSGIRR